MFSYASKVKRDFLESRTTFLVVELEEWFDDIQTQFSLYHQSLPEGSILIYDLFPILASSSDVEDLVWIEAFEDGQENVVRKAVFDRMRSHLEEKGVAEG